MILMKGILNRSFLMRLSLLPLTLAMALSAVRAQSPLEGANVADESDEALEKQIQDLDPHRSIRPLFDPLRNVEGLSLSLRLFPRDILKAFEESSSRSASESPTKRALLKTIALRSITQFQDPLTGLGDLQQLVSNFSGIELDSLIVSKLNWATFDKKIKDFALLKLEKPSETEMNNYLDSVDKEFTHEEKTTLVVAIHLQYLKTMRESLPETHSDADLGTLMQLETWIEASPDLCLRLLEVDGDYRGRKAAAAESFVWKYADRGIESFLEVKARVYPLRRISTFAHFQDEADQFEEILRQQIRSEKMVSESPLDLRVVAFATVFERLADAQDPAVWDWERDPDLNRIEEIIKNARGRLDAGERRWILENSENYFRAVAAEKFESSRGERAMGVAVKNGAWAIPVASALMVRYWLHARSLIQLSDRMFREEALLIQQAVKNGAGDISKVSELIAGLSKPAALEASTFAKNLSIGLSGRDMGREALMFIPPQPAKEIATKMPKGLSPAAQDAIAAAVQQRQYLLGFGGFISKLVSKAPDAARYEKVIGGLVSQILKTGTQRSLSLATRLSGGLQAANGMRVGPARGLLTAELNVLKVAEVADIAVSAKRLVELHGRVLKVVRIARYKAYLSKIASIEKAAEGGGRAANAWARFHKVASWFAWQAGNKISSIRMSRYLKGLSYQPQNGIRGWISSFRAMPQGAEYGATLPGMLSGNSKIINFGKGFVRNLPIIVTAAGAGLYAWQVGSTYWKGDADQEFDNYLKKLKEDDAARGLDTEMNAQRKMRPKNESAIASELDRAINVSNNPLEVSFNRDRELRGLPRIEIIMNVESMAPLNLKTGFATYIYALIKVADSQTLNNESERARNIRNGILVRYEQKQEGSDEAMKKKLRLSWAPADVYWVFDHAVILRPINPDTDTLIRRAIHGTGDTSLEIRIQHDLADTLFAKLAGLW